MYNTIFLFDTSIATENLGDFIIMDAVKKQLRGVFKDDFFVSTATHDTLGKSAKEWYHSAEYSFVGGTNLLTDRFIGRNRSQWKYGFRDMQVSNSIEVGLGWQSYKNYDRLMERPLKWAQKKFIVVHFRILICIQSGILILKEGYHSWESIPLIQHVLRCGI